MSIYLSEASQAEKPLSSASQDHAAAVRDLINQFRIAVNRVLRSGHGHVATRRAVPAEFQDNETTTVLTTSQKLSTGVDAQYPQYCLAATHQLHESIQTDHWTRHALFDGKDYFTIYDFVNAYHHFSDPEWDGSPSSLSPPSQWK